MNTTIQGDQSKAAIIQAGIDLWHESGERAVSARAIGKRVGLSHAGVIYHFGKVADLIDAIKRRAIENGDGLIIRQLIAGNDPLVAEWSQADRTAWLTSVQ